MKLPDWLGFGLQKVIACDGLLSISALGVLQIIDYLFLN
jgi:hypothetical protein